MHASIVKRIALACASFVAFSASADMLTLRADGLTVQLSDKACPAPVIDLILPQFQAQFREAFIVIRGRQLKGCWTFNDGNVVLVDEEGDAGELPSAAFKSEPSV